MAEVFVDVLLPLSVKTLFTYHVPSHLNEEIAVGKRVIVPFGRQKIYSALIRNVRREHPEPEKLKEIHSVLDDNPIINEKQYSLWEWISEYYMCTTGEVMNSALPASLKLQSETTVLPAEVTEVQLAEMSSDEQQLYEALVDKKEMSVDEIARLFRRSSVHKLLKKSFEKGYIVLSEEIRQGYKARKEARLRLAAAYKSESALEGLFLEYDNDSRKSKQLATLMVFMKYLFEDPDRESVKKSTLVNHEGISKSSVTTLITNGVLVEFDVVVERIPPAGKNLIRPMKLSAAQETSLQKIHESFNQQSVTLFHGVTSSGKTEVYIHLIEEMISKGKQVLYLLPEIALTTQLIVRLRRYFGDTVGVYHSRYSSNERVEVWNHVLDFANGKGSRSQVILGARSSLFLPFSDLGLVIVDEEHDQSFKQSDPAPRYNARDAAIMLAKIHGAKTLLGSATPSMESYYNAERNRYGLVGLAERYGGVQMPEIVVADVSEARRKKMMKANFTPELIRAVQEALAEKEQVILFQNRRGFSNFIECRNCNYVPHCRNCSVTLTYHKQSHALKCHYCGYTVTVPSSCPECGDFHLEVKGFGTEQIEEDMAVFFPDATIARMDLDSTRTKSSFQKIIADFEERRIDILVGTQMVTKGLDFDNVSTVGIINADQLLNFPDFRSFERSYQLLAQVSGRSGRKSKRGKVIIQTQKPDHWVIIDVVKNDYENFYRRDLLERQKFGYPPHSRLIELTLRNKDAEKVTEAAADFAVLLKKRIGNRVLGPHIPLISKIRNLFYRTVLIKIERNISPAEIKKGVAECIREFYADRENLSVQIIPDVDPI